MPAKPTRKPRTKRVTLWCVAGRSSGMPFHSSIADTKPGCIEQFTGHADGYLDRERYQVVKLTGEVVLK